MSIAIKLPAKIKISGFNCHFTSETDPQSADRLLQEPWYSVHREQIERILYSEFRHRFGNEFKSMEFVCETDTLLEHIRREMGGYWNSSRWKAEFDKYDTSMDGTLDRQEFKKLINQFRCTMSEQEFQNLWHTADAESNDKITFFDLIQVGSC
jgi:hypothetical protein